jgi:hypothetical protein
LGKAALEASESRLVYTDLKFCRGKRLHATVRFAQDLV